jgi:hypothetical protein
MMMNTIRMFRYTFLIFPSFLKIFSYKPRNAHVKYNFIASFDLLNPRIYSKYARKGWRGVAYSPQNLRVSGYRSDM